jgi:hypothetical protein
LCAFCAFDLVVRLGSMVVFVLAAPFPMPKVVDVSETLLEHLVLAPQ